MNCHQNMLTVDVEKPLVPYTIQLKPHGVWETRSVCGAMGEKRKKREREGGEESVAATNSNSEKRKKEEVLPSTIKNKEKRSAVHAKLKHDKKLEKRKKVKARDAAEKRALELGEEVPVALCFQSHQSSFLFSFSFFGFKFCGWLWLLFLCFLASAEEDTSDNWEHQGVGWDCLPARWWRGLFSIFSIPVLRIHVCSLKLIFFSYSVRWKTFWMVKFSKNISK